jgi:hypothetical protein
MMATGTADMANRRIVHMVEFSRSVKEKRQEELVLTE